MIEYLKSKAKEHTIGILDLSKNEFDNFLSHKLYHVVSGHIEQISFSGLKVIDRFNLIELVEKKDVNELKLDL
jgi:hypothetical protein